MSSHKEGKKSHKRKSVADDGRELTVTVTDPSSSAGPVFANYPAVRPSANLPFTIWSLDPSGSKALPEQSTILAGETEDVEFFSTNRSGKSQARGEGADCQYLPAIYDPDTGSLTIHQSTPLYLMSHRVKRLKILDAEANKQAQGWEAFKAQRNLLGETFGTKKAKTQIRAEERNRVDIGAMQSVKGHLMEAIGEKAADDKVIAPNEVVPTPNLETTDPARIYAREVLIPDEEWKAIDHHRILRAEDDEGRMSCCPHKSSALVAEKMRLAAESTDSSTIKKATIRMAYYLAALLAFDDLKSLENKSTKDIQHRTRMPLQLVNGLLDRFTETNGKKHVMTDKTRIKLHTWICAVVLHLENFSVDIAKVGRELGLPPTKVQSMFRDLGCKTELMPQAERERMGITIQDARDSRRAVLRAPVVYPKLGLRGPVRR